MFRGISYHDAGLDNNVYLRILVSATAVQITDFPGAMWPFAQATCTMYTHCFFAFLSNLQFSFIPFHLPTSQKKKKKVPIILWVNLLLA